MPSLTKRILRFILALSLLVLVIFLAKYPIQFIPAFTKYSEVVDKTGFHPGALYYSDVSVTMESEKKVRKAVKEGMELRKKNAEEEKEI